jgi:hypothetical protein
VTVGWRSSKVAPGIRPGARSAVAFAPPKGSLEIRDFIRLHERNGAVRRSAFPCFQVQLGHKKHFLAHASHASRPRLTRFSSLGVEWGFIAPIQKHSSVESIPERRHPELVEGSVPLSFSCPYRTDPSISLRITNHPIFISRCENNVPYHFIPHDTGISRPSPHPHAPRKSSCFYCSGGL